MARCSDHCPPRLPHRSNFQGWPRHDVQACADGVRHIAANSNAPVVLCRATRIALRRSDARQSRGTARGRWMRHRLASHPREYTHSVHATDPSLRRCSGDEVREIDGYAHGADGAG
jgi:hypothetical protein